MDLETVKNYTIAILRPNEEESEAAIQHQRDRRSNAAKIKTDVLNGKIDKEAICSLIDDYCVLATGLERDIDQRDRRMWKIIEAIMAAKTENEVYDIRKLA